MTSIHHTPESLPSPSGKRLPSKLPAEEPGNTNAKRKGKQKAIPEIHTFPPSELPPSSEISERHLWPSAPSTSSYLERASWRHLNSIPDGVEESAVAGGSGQNRQDDHKTPSSTRELPEPLGLREHQLETSVPKQLPKEENTEDNGAKIAKAREQPKKLGNISRSQSASRATGRRNSLIQGLRDIVEPLTKLGKGKMTFRKTQRLVCVPEQMDDNISGKPGAICPDLKKPPETETGTTIRAKNSHRGQKGPGRGHQIALQKTPACQKIPHMKRPLRPTATPRRTTGGTVKCGGTTERRRGKHSLGIKSHATRGTNYKNKEQGSSATPDTPGKGHMGRVTIGDEHQPMTQGQMERQTRQKIDHQDKERHTMATIARAGRAKQCPSASPSSSTLLENHQGTTTSTSAFADTTTALSTISMEDDCSWCQSSYESAEDRGRSGVCSPPPLSWSPPPLDSYPLRLPSPAYMPRSPTPRPPLNSAELSPLSSPSPMNLEYPSPCHNRLNKPESLQLLIRARTLGFQGTRIGTIDKLSMDGRGPVTHHHTRKEILLPNKETIKVLKVATPSKGRTHTLIYDALKLPTSGRLLFKIGIQQECKGMLQIALEICIPHKEHLEPIDTSLHFRETTWHDPKGMLQKCPKENPTHQSNFTTVPEGHQQVKQRLPGEEQTYSLRWQGCQSRQMRVLERLAKGRKIKVNPVRTTETITWPLEPGGTRRTRDTSGAPKHQGSFIQEFGRDTKSHTGITKREKSHKWTQDCVGTAKESALTCLDSGEPFKPGKDASAYGIGLALCLEKKDKRERSMNCFSVDLRRMRQRHNNQKEESPTTTTERYLQTHSLKRPLYEMITRVDYENSQNHCRPWRTNFRVTWDVTRLENHYNRAGCPLRTKNYDVPIERSEYDQRKENKAMPNEQNHWGKEGLEGREDRHDEENTKILHAQSQQYPCNTTAASIIGPLYGTDSLRESEQPRGSEPRGETDAEKIRFALIGNKVAPLIVHLLLHLFTLYERITAHHSFDLPTPQSGDLQRKTNPGRNPADPLRAHTVADSNVFWQSRRQILNGKFYGREAHKKRSISTPKGPTLPTHIPHTSTTTRSLITAMTRSYTYEEQALRILQLHARWNARIMRKIDTIRNTLPEDLSELYELYGLLIWPYTIEEIIRDLRTPLLIFPNEPEAIPTLAEWQPQPEGPDPWAANAGNWGAAWGEGAEPW
jgi:hypothetical protein